MTAIRKITILALIGLTIYISVGQNRPTFPLEKELKKLERLNKSALYDIATDYDSTRIFQLEKNLEQGDKSALFEIASYFDSKKIIEVSLDHHRYLSTESDRSKWLVVSNSLFTDTEIQISDLTSAEQFTMFLNSNKDKIVFSDLANKFLITPLDKREVDFEIKELSSTRKKELQDHYLKIVSSTWIKEYKIDSLFKEKNPVLLLTLVSELYKRCSMEHTFSSESKKYIDLLQLMTGIEIGVINDKGKISWHIEEDVDTKSKLNLLIYFSKYYLQYSWDQNQFIFTSPNSTIKLIGKEEELFQLMMHENDSVAMNAFIRLTTCNPVIISQLLKQYTNEQSYINNCLPYHTYIFLNQLVLLTEYCKTNNIDYLGSLDLRKNIEKLQQELPFLERRLLEDKLIQSLSLDDITAFEYWALIYQKNFYLDFSAGRILDIFYSRNWQKLLNNKKHLECFLKKSKLFSQLGTFDICNNYLIKFSHSSDTTLLMLRKYQTMDTDIQEQLSLIVSLNFKENQTRNEKTSPKENKVYHVDNLEKKLLKFANNIHADPNNPGNFIELLSQISYEQIPTAIHTIQNDSFRAYGKIFRFMEEDWGFFMVGNFEEKETRDTFLKLYAQYSEYQLYAYYLDLADIDYKNEDNTLNFDKIYEMLKYDITVSFANQFKIKYDNQVYSLIKLLELTFQTTLGFSKKFCDSYNMDYCDASERAKAWMKYLTDHKSLKQKHDEPVSFNYK